ncbi:MULTISPECIES: Maf family protein [Vibrio]|uniref:7-methyl-GTP pyrophosphatase n=1 Tax=Vibrio aestuarianus TaxID=28171 RepID=A0A9X4FAR6_9VIBR|nr:MULTISPECIES: nucleoside triphosphate pyrophosphatase [Vibrio]MDE1213404.1 Maf-like protein [Vibrio aestuarianus]MDE1216392.1 Maf-like protein [Vibrio aestuarianus]MDE1235335.1 Maf-like protein [Vibrio aestuarianus]MDE1239148.1 Maf-like protein [Vibrio aestuarianus]MDE1246213.1 Maf-like protein [Vibrio aestuarianus]
MQNYQLVLASTSPFRQQLLKKLGLPFVTASPQCDETAHQGESPQALVTRLAEEKARSCTIDQASLVIGSDQVCVINGEIVGKPHTKEQAIAQLLKQSGKAITFYTGLALYNSCSNTCLVDIDTFIVHFRNLSLEMATAYVEKEQPLQCAGSFMSEGLGIALFERLEGDDPNTLVGLPLIKLVKLLESQGVNIL